MKALVPDKYGSPDFLEIREIEKPIPAENEVLVKVHAVSINEWDLMHLDDNFVKRLLDHFRPRRIMGSDIAGRVESVGRGVNRFKPGDAVYGDLSRFSLSGGWGGFAEYVRAPEKSLVLKPAGMTFEQAAAIPQAGMLAVQGLLDKGQLRPGQRVLINGAGGGVGTFAVQLAKLPKFQGVEVTGVDSAEKLDMLRSVGFDHVIDYQKEDFTKSGKCYDLILDTRTNRPALDYARVLNPSGTYATVGGTSHLGQFALLGLWQFVLGGSPPWIRELRGKKLALVMLKQNKDLPYLNELFEAGQFTPVIDGHYTFSESREALRHYLTAKHKGKVVVTIDGEGVAK